MSEKDQKTIRIFGNARTLHDKNVEWIRNDLTQSWADKEKYQINYRFSFALETIQKKCVCIDLEPTQASADKEKRVDAG